MSPEMSATPKPVLAYDRRSSNQQMTKLLLGVFVVITLPVAWYATEYIATWIIMLSPANAELSYTRPVLAMSLSMISALLILVAIAWAEYRWCASLVMGVAGARNVSASSHPDLCSVVENLSIGAGLPVPRLYVLEAEAPNAFSTGFAPEHASLAVTSGLLRILDRQELEAVVAHELSHIGNRDTRLGAMLAAVVATLWLPHMIVYRFFRLLFRKNALLGAGCLVLVVLFFLPLLPIFIGVLTGSIWGDYPAIDLFSLLLLVWFVYVVAGGPFFALLLKPLLWRERESQADAEAVLLTRNPAAMKTALVKMSECSAPRLEIIGALRHLCIVDPLNPSSRGDVLSCHPLVENRIKALEQMGAH